MKMTKDEHEEVTRLADEVLQTLAEAFAMGDPASNVAQKRAELHKKWLTYYWSEYSKEAWDDSIPSGCDPCLYRHFKLTVAFAAVFSSKIWYVVKSPQKPFNWKRMV